MTLPVLFVPHGGPDLVVSQTPERRFLERLGRYLPRPKAIVVISAHWQEQGFYLGDSETLETIHDFFGFPRALYELQYPAKGEPALAQRIAELLAAQDLPTGLSPRGLDHGAWNPLMLMHPEAEVPVVPLSLRAGVGSGEAGPEAHYRLGQALRPLRGEGVLILASGVVVHNLRRIDPRPGAEVMPWAQAFDDWLWEGLQSGQHEALFNYRREAPHARAAHPTEEHLLPLFVALGAGEDLGPCRRLHSGFSLGSLSTAGYGWGLSPEQVSEIRTSVQASPQAS